MLSPINICNKSVDTSAPVLICPMDSRALVPKGLGSEVSVYLSLGLLLLQCFDTVVWVI